MALTRRCRRPSAADWSAPWPIVSMSIRTAGLSGSAARHLTAGSALTVTAASRRSSRGHGLWRRARALSGWSLRFRSSGSGRRGPRRRSGRSCSPPAGPLRGCAHCRRISRGRGSTSAPTAARQGRSMAASKPRSATSCGPATDCTAPPWPAPRRGGRCCWRSSTTTRACWSVGAGAAARTCSAWRPRCARG